MSGPMTLKELQELLDVHGGDPARWPARKRARMTALCAADAHAAKLAARARALDLLISETAVPPAGPELKAAILSAATGASGGLAAMPAKAPAAARGPANDNFPSRWLTGGLLAASLMLGVWLGLSGALSPLNDALAGPVRTATVNDAAFGELLELTGAADNQGDLM